MKQLTRRDQALLLCLSKCGVIIYGQAKAIYNVDQYHYKRLRELEERRYVKCGNKYIEITPLGMKALGSSMPPVRVRGEWKREYLARLAQIYVALPGWTYLSSREVKKEMNLPSSAVMGCYVERSGQGYAIYLLNDEPRKSTVRSVKSELKKLWTFQIKRAVVFCPSPAAMATLDKIETRLEELLVLPYPFGISLLVQRDRIESAIRAGFPDYVPSNRPFADFEDGRTFISVLVFNDLAKRELLHNYVKYAQAKEGKQIQIVCLESQAAKFAALFPGIRQVVLDDSAMVSKPAEEGKTDAEGKTSNRRQSGNLNGVYNSRRE